VATSNINRFNAKRVAAAVVATAVWACLPALTASAATAGSAAAADTATVKLQTGLIVSLDPSRRTAVQEKAYRDQISRLEAQGKLTPAVMTQMRLRQLTPATTSAAVTQARATAPAKASSLAAYGCSITNPQTSAAAISLAAPKITINYSSQNYIMYANASYKWTSPPTAPSTCVMKVGGVDGFALALNRTSTNLGVSFWACNSYGKCGSNGYLETNSQYGGGWALQDYATSALLGSGDTYSGTLTYAFRVSGGGCTQAFSKYGHDWNSTSVNGFSIGPWSIGVQWTSASSTWTKSSQAGSYGTC
jgi:hypothetical protein